MKPILNHKLAFVKSQPGLNPMQRQPSMHLSALTRGLLVLALLLGASLLPAGATPAAAQTLPLVGTSLSAGNLHVCAVTSSGGVKCWGANSLYQLNGDTSLTTSPHPTPVAVDLNGDTAVSVAAGQDGTCALLSSGDAKCWGYYNGAAGPIVTINLSGSAVAIAPGGYHYCALMNTGDVKCWGVENTHGELGNGTFTAVASYAAAGITNDVLGVSSAVAIDAGHGLSSGAHSCAILSNGSMKCWGANVQGELGDGTTTNRNVAVNVLGLGGSAVSLSVGTQSTCAVLSTGGVKCWGSTPFGASAVPTNVVGLTSGVASVEIGYSGGGADTYICALMTTGKVKCLGGDIYDYQYASASLNGNPMGTGYDGPVTTPTDVVGLSSSVVSMSSGDNFNCVLLITGEVKCVGNNLYGQFGLPAASSYIYSYAYVTSVSGLSGASGAAVYTPLSISKSAPSPYPPVAGQPVAYTIQVTNSNTNALTNVTVTDLPAPSLSMTGFSSSPAGTCSTTTRKCTLTSALAAGASASFNVTFTTSSSVGAIITNTAYVTASQSAMWTYPTAPMLVLQSATASAGGGTASLKVTKSASVAQATTGTPFDYTVTVTNTGATAATNVKATDKLPAGVTFNSASILSGTGSCSQAAGVVTCIWGSVGAGASVSAKITVTP